MFKVKLFLFIFGGGTQREEEEKVELNETNLGKLKMAITEELNIPASVYQPLFHWTIFSLHALVSAEMYSQTKYVS